MRFHNVCPVPAQPLSGGLATGTQPRVLLVGTAGGATTMQPRNHTTPSPLASPAPTGEPHSLAGPAAVGWRAVGGRMFLQLCMLTSIIIRCKMFVGRRPRTQVACNGTADEQM